MHLVGKIFLGLTFVAGVAAVLLLAKLLHVRGERQQAYDVAAATAESRETQFEQVREEIVTERRRSATVQALWHQPVVVPADGVAVSDTGALKIDIGTDVGFGIDDPERQAAQVHFAFSGGPGESVFIGPFVLAESRQTRSLLEPAFAVGQDELDDWPAGPWRFWEAVPPSAPAEVNRLRGRLEEANVTRDARASTFDRQRLAVRQARDQLDAMLSRLEGDPDANPVEGSPEVTEGLVATVAAETADRDRTLARLRELRDEVAAAYAKLERTLTENRELARRIADDVGARVARGD